MNYTAILFDLDGTLLDTLDDLADSMNAALAKLGCAQYPVEKYRYFVGDGVIELARRTLPPEKRDDASLKAAASAMREEYAQRWQSKTRPYKGVAEMLDELTARKVPMAILSNKPDDFTKLCVGKLLGRWKFDCVQGLDSTLKKKPDPSGALAVARKLGVAPDQFVYVGDTNTDMQTAVAAGMFPVGALWGFRTAEELNANGAKVLVAQPPDLLQFF